MIRELKEIREQLLIAIDSKDLLYAKMMVNRIDTLIYKSEVVKNNAVLPLVSNLRELLINFKRWEYKNNICYDDTCDESVIDRYLDEIN